MKVSIITVCYNSAATIEKTIQSVIGQTHPDIEYIIIDGQSKDATLAIVKEYEPYINKVVSENDNGLYDAMNKGIALATGEVISIINSDDFYADQFVIEKIVKKFSPAIDAVYGDIVYVDKEQTTKVKRYWRSGIYKRYKMQFGWMPPHPSFFVRSQVYKKYNSFNTSFRTSADYELMLRFIYKHRIRLAYLPEILVHMRDGGQSNASIKNRLRANNEDIRAWKVNNLNTSFLFRFLKPLRKLPQFIFIKSKMGTHL